MRPRRAGLALFGFAVAALAHGAEPYPPPAEVRAAFLKQLDRPKVAAEATIPERWKEGGLAFERLTIASERKADGTLERVPLLIVRAPEGPARRATVIVLHGTGGTKEGQRPWLERLARKGILAVALDARYHGARTAEGTGSTAYDGAIIQAWRARPGERQEHPFYFDTVWDIWRTLDYLESRSDVDPARIGMIGFSMGGIETWLAAAADQRVKVVVPAIAVQSFRWTLEHDRWQGRAATIKAAHVVAAADLGEPAVNARVCRALWSKIVPGILDQFDGPSMLRLMAGRPLLLLNGEDDPNCPIEGARLAFAAAEEAYAQARAGDRLRVMVAANTPHRVTDEQSAAALEWLVFWLQP